jgi:hypothetical protein
MTDFRASDQDVNRAIRSWLREDRHEDVSRIAGAVLDQLDTTPQRRATWWPAWRTPTMNKFVAIGLGAAAVVVALFVGVQFFSSPDGGTGGQPSPSPTIEATPGASAADPIDFAALAMGDRLVDGDYVFTHMDGLRVVFTASPAWERNFPNWVVWSIDDHKATMGVSTVDNVVIDPCQPELGFQDPAVGPTVDDLVTALNAVPGLTFSAPEAVTQDGYEGIRLDYVPPDEFDDCLDDLVEAMLMTVDGKAASDSIISAPSGDDAFSLFIFDIEGTRVVIVAAFTPSRTDELYEMLNSIRFEQP